MDDVVALERLATLHGAFVDDASVDTKDLKRRLIGRLPRYMVPKQIHTIESFPLNANGKIDRKALLARLQDA